MAAPTPSPRTTPNGNKVDDGHQTLVNFAAHSDICFWEKSVTPPGYDGGDKNDTTTMWNTRYRSSAPRKLIEMTDFTMTAAYDPKIYVDINDLINVETTVTVHFPNGDTLAFFGYLQKFEPDALEEGSQPECTITVVCTNADPTTGAEEDPVYHTAAGT